MDLVEDTIGGGGDGGGGGGKDAPREQGTGDWGGSVGGTTGGSGTHGELALNPRQPRNGTPETNMRMPDRFLSAIRAMSQPAHCSPGSRDDTRDASDASDATQHNPA